MSLEASYFDNVINYSVCFQDVSVNELDTLLHFLESKFSKDVYEVVYSDSHLYIMKYVVWLKFHDKPSELLFKLIWPLKG
jgi:hypothetical protein